MFLLRAPDIIPHMAVRGNIRQLGYWNSPPPEHVHLHIPKTGEYKQRGYNTAIKAAHNSILCVLYLNTIRLNLSTDLMCR